MANTWVTQIILRVGPFGWSMAHLDMDQIGFLPLCFMKKVLSI